MLRLYKNTPLFEDIMEFMASYMPLHNKQSVNFELQGGKLELKGTKDTDSGFLVGYELDNESPVILHLAKNPVRLVVHTFDPGDTDEDLESKQVFNFVLNHFDWYRLGKAILNRVIYDFGVR